MTKQLLMMEDLGPVQMVADRLVDLYPDEWSLRRVLALAHVDAARIPFDGIAANACWYAALEAARQGQAKRLVEVMVEEYPLDPWVIVLHAKMRKGETPP
jgi:hypothetical protein